MRVLICDVETSGLSWDEGARVLEVAAMLFDTKYASPMCSFSALIKHHENQAEKINGISVGLLQEQGYEARDVWRRFADMASAAECCLAHRSEFDQGFVTKSIEAELTNQPGLILSDWNRPWVCSKTDIQWVGDRRGDSLVQLALSMGLGVASAHRAMSDVDTLARILTRAAEMGMDLEAAMRKGMRPKKLFYALVSYDQRQTAKDAGFMWDEPKHGKNWFRNMPPEEAAGLPFRVREVSER